MSKHYYLQLSTRRLFICGDKIQSTELKRMLRGDIRLLKSSLVTYTRAHDPYSDEIDLTKRRTVGA